MRPSWSGALTLSLITIPIRAYAATRPHADVSFRQFHAVCHTPIQLKKWCPHCEIEVAPDAIVRGHETSKGRYVFVDDEEIQRARPSSTGTLEISTVIDASVLDARYIERVYFLSAATGTAASAAAVLGRALDGRAAIGRFAAHGREYVAAVVSQADRLTMYTLRTAGEVVDRSAVPRVDAGAAPKAAEVKLARQVLDQFASNVSPATFEDRYEKTLREIVARKGGGAAVESEAERGAGTRAPGNLLDALRRSLDAAKRRSEPRRAKVLAHPASRSHRRAS